MHAATLASLRGSDRIRTVAARACRGRRRNRTCRARRAVGASEGGGDALLSFENSAQRRPTGILTGLTQTCADHLHELIGDHGDEQMAVGADGLVVIDRA